MSIKEEFEDLLRKLNVEHDKVNLNLHLASMEVKEEFEEAEKQWVHLKAKTAEIVDDKKEASEELIAKARIVGEELKDTYYRINKRLSK